MSSESPIVEEVRRRAFAQSEKYGHDLRKYAEHLHEIEQRHRDRVVDQITIVSASKPNKAEQ